MSIITWMGATVSAYLADRLTWWDAVLETQHCPHCQCLCRRHSVRWRAAWTQFLLRTDERIPILRIYCPLCCTTFTILPDFLTPRHRYQVLVREAVVTHAVTVPPCCPQTTRRWRQAWGAALTLAVQHVTSWLLQAPVPLRGQERRFLTGELHGYAGLQRGRRLAAQYGREIPASGLFGWVNQLCWSTKTFVL